MIYYFVMNCKPNQIIAFKHIKWFVDQSDVGFGCSKVLRAILDGNTGSISMPNDMILDTMDAIDGN